jgi:hypothetical protein
MIWAFLVSGTAQSFSRVLARLMLSMLRKVDFKLGHGINVMSVVPQPDNRPREVIFIA